MVKMKMQPFEGEGESGEGESAQREDKKMAWPVMVSGAVILIIVAVILAFVMRRRLMRAS